MKNCSSPSQLGRLIRFLFALLFSCALFTQCAAEKVGVQAARSSQQLSSGPSETSFLRRSITAHDNDQIKKMRQRVGNRRAYEARKCFSLDDLPLLTDSTGEIDYYFDGFGEQYEANQECWWAVQVVGATAIKISFSNFETEANYDFVGVIYCESDEECFWLDSFPHSGNSLPAFGATVTVPKNTFFVQFTSDQFTHGRGFKLEYETVEALTCQSTPSAALTASEGTVNYYNEGVNYGNDLECAWILAPSEEVTSFSFVFENLRTQYLSDFVRIYSCSEITEDPLACVGETEVLAFSGSIAPWGGQIVSSRYAMIKFISDSTPSFAAYGFRVTYQTSNEVADGGNNDDTGNCPSGASVTVDDEQIGSVNHFFETGYQFNSRCWWFLDPPDEWSEMSISITELDTEGGWDLVYILNCPDRSSVSTSACTVLSEFSGSTIPAENNGVLPIHASSHITVLFTSDWGTEMKGFILKYSEAATGSAGVSCPSFDYAQTFAGTEMSGSVTFWFEDQYPTNANCYWIFKPEDADATDFSFAITFEELATEQDFDVVEIKRCSGAACSLSEWVRQDTEYSGDEIPQVPQFVGQAVMIAFSSDALVSMKGFKLSFTAAVADSPSGGGSEGSGGGNELCSDFAQSKVYSDAAGDIEYKPPGGYGQTDNCHWIIAPSGSGPENRYQIELTFKNDEYWLNFCDSLSAYECDTVACDEDGRRLLVTGMNPYSVVSATAEVAMLVKFTACSYMTPNAGFIVEYVATPPACQPVVITETGGDIIFQPDGGYKSNQRCSWILPPNGPALEDTQSFVLSFQSFITELNYDLVSVWACQSFDPDCTFGVLVQEWSGTGPGPDASSSFNSPFIMIKFESDNFQEPSDGGFRLQYTVSSAAAGGNDGNGGGGAATATATCRGIEDPVREFSAMSSINFWFETETQAQYPSQSNCVWIISPAQASMVTLTINQIDTEEDYDIVTVFECNTAVCDSGRPLGVYSGTTSGMIVASLSGILLLEFRSDSGVNGRGFKASWTSTGGINADCQQKKVEPTVGSEPDSKSLDHLMYATNQKCSWIISSAENTQLQVKFTAFSTEKSYDVLRMWSCLDVTCDEKVLRHELSGDANDVKTILSQGGEVPKEMEITYSSNRVLIEFRSDASDNGQGFQLTYEELKSDSKQRAGCPQRDPKSSEDNFQIIKFPEGRAEYSNMVTCSWAISVPPQAKNMETILEFQRIDTEINSDFVRVYGCPTTQAGSADCDSDQWLISELSGAHELWEGNALPKIVSESSLLVEFTSDRSNAYSGFEFQWKRQLQSESACSTFSFRKQVQGSVEFESTDSERQSCSWLIAPPGVGSVTIEFKELMIEGGVDTVTIKGCKDLLCENDAIFLGVWTGNYPEEDLPPAVFWDGFPDSETGDTSEILIRVDFFAGGNTDPVADSRSFRLEYTSQRGTPVQPESTCPDVGGAGPCPSLDCCSLRGSACVDRECKQCPVGATCFHGQFIRGKYNGEKWLLDRTAREYYIAECPPGFQKVRPMADGVYEWSKALCRPCGAGRYIMHEENECQICPPGAVCECAEDTTNEGVVVCNFNKDKMLINGEEIVFVGAWKRNETAGHFELDYCPEGTTLINTVATTTSRGSGGAAEVFDASVQECRKCKDEDEYVITPNRIKNTTTVTVGGKTQLIESYKYFKCQPCPVGGRCMNGIFESGKTMLAEEVWKADLNLEQYVLQHCPPGHEKVTWATTSAFGSTAATVDTTIFDHVSQQCRPCEEDQYIVNPDVDRCTVCPNGGVCDGSHLTGKIFRPGVSKSLDIWVLDDQGHEYRLASCPFGHRLVNTSAAKVNDDNTTTPGSFAHALQECQQCPPGTQCTEQNCTSSVCNKCPAGTYKAIQSAQLCDKCPLGRYNPSEGSSSLGDCQACPDDATTASTGAKHPGECICRKPNTYTRVNPENGVVNCQQCPTGGICVGGRVRGKETGVVFQKDDQTGFFRIVECPVGFVGVRSDNEGNEGNDDCVRCPAGLYLLDEKWVNDSVVYRAECKVCPAGATCIGGSVIPQEGFWRNIAAEQAYLSGTSALPTKAGAGNYSEDYLASLSYYDPTQQNDIWAELEKEYEFEKERASDNQGPVCDFGDYECLEDYFTSQFENCPPRECMLERLPTSCGEIHMFKDDLAECYEEAGCCFSWAQEMQAVIEITGLDNCDYSTVCDDVLGSLLGPNRDGYDSEYGYRDGEYEDEDVGYRPGYDGGQVCGDGWLQEEEQCDDGNTVSGDGCDSDCRYDDGDNWGLRRKAAAKQQEKRRDSKQRPASASVIYDSYYTYYNSASLPVGGRRSSLSRQGLHSNIRRAYNDSQSDSETIKGDRKGQALVFPCPSGNCFERNECREGHHGPVCGICDDGWVRTGEGLCELCRKDDGKSPKKELAIALSVAAACCLYIYFAVFPMVAPLLGRKRMDAQQMGQHKAKFEALRSKLQGMFKIVVSALQVSSSFVSTFAVEWPGSFQTLMSAAWIARLDLLTLPTAACMTEGFAFTDMLFAKTLGPLLITFILAIPILIVALRAWKYSIPLLDDCTRKKQSAASTLQADEDSVSVSSNGPKKPSPYRFSESYHDTVDAFWYAMVLLWYLLYPMCSIAALSALNCQDVGYDQRLLASDYGEICPMDPDGDGQLLTFVGFAILVYPIGLPLLLLLSLELNNIPALSYDIQNSAVLKAMLEHLRDRNGKAHDHDDDMSETDATTRSAEPDSPQRASQAAQRFLNRSTTAKGQTSQVSLESLCPPGVRGSCLLEYFCLVLGKPPSALLNRKAKISAVAYVRALWLLDKANPLAQVSEDHDVAHNDEALTKLTAKEMEFLAAFKLWLGKKGASPDQGRTLKKGRMPQTEDTITAVPEDEAAPIPEVTVDTTEEETFLHIMKETHFTDASSSWWKCFEAKQVIDYKLNESEFEEYLKLALETEASGSSSVPQEKHNGMQPWEKDYAQALLLEHCAQFLELVDKQARIYTLLAKNSRRARRLDIHGRKNTPVIEEVHKKIARINLMDSKDCNAKTIHLCLHSFSRHEDTTERIKVLLKAIYTTYDIPEVKQIVEDCWTKALGLKTDDEPSIFVPKVETPAQCCGGLRSVLQKCMSRCEEIFQQCGEKLMGKPPGWKKHALHHSLLAIATHLYQQDIIAVPALSWDIQEEPEPAEKEYLDTKAKSALMAAVAFAQLEKNRLPQNPAEHADTEAAVEDRDLKPNAEDVEKACGLCQDLLFLRPSISWANLLAKYKGIFKGRCEFVIMTNVEYCKAAKRGVDRVGFLFKTYQVDYWYFELIEMIRKLLMTAILIFMFPGTPAQVISGLVLSLAFLYIYMSTTPFRDPELDHLQISTLVAQHCTLIYGLMAYMSGHDLEGARDNTGIVGWTVTLMNVYCIFAPIYNHFSKIFQGFSLIKKTINDVFEGLRALQSILACFGICGVAGAAAAADNETNDNNFFSSPAAEATLGGVSPGVSLPPMAINAQQENAGPDADGAREIHLDSAQEDPGGALNRQGSQSFASEGATPPADMVASDPFSAVADHALGDQDQAENQGDPTPPASIVAGMVASDPPAAALQVDELGDQDEAENQGDPNPPASVVAGMVASELGATDEVEDHGARATSSRLERGAPGDQVQVENQGDPNPPASVVAGMVASELGATDEVEDHGARATSSRLERGAHGDQVQGGNQGLVSDQLSAGDQTTRGGIRLSPADGDGANIPLTGFQDRSDGGIVSAIEVTTVAGQASVTPPPDAHGTGWA